MIPAWMVLQEWTVRDAKVRFSRVVGSNPTQLARAALCVVLGVVAFAMLSESMLCHSTVV